MKRINEYIESHAWTWWAISAAYWTVFMTAYEMLKEVAR